MSTVIGRAERERDANALKKRVVKTCLPDESREVM